MNEHSRCLILFARYPVPGQVKTRLIPALGTEGAAALHRRLVLHTLRAARAACEKLPMDLQVRFSGGSERSMSHWLGDSIRFVSQGPGDLGQRMACAFDESFRDGSTGTVLIGSDCPGLSAETIITAFGHLKETSVVLGPAQDGGYYLVGLSRPIPEMFRGIPWGTDKVLADSLAVLERHGAKGYLLEPLADIDRPEDLPVWQRIAATESAGLDKVSVIIPALNEEKNIVSTLKAVGQCKCHEVIVVDGGSSDSTVNLAKEADMRVLNSKPGRALQMNAGAALAEGDTLLFLHADTLLPPTWAEAAARTLRLQNVVAGAFRFSIASAFRGKSFVEWSTHLRSRWLQRPYGDQGLFLTRALFEELGGFADLPIMEDYELTSRLRGLGRVVTVNESVLTSGRRWETLGAFRTTLRNQWMLMSYHLGVTPQKLATRYGKLKPKTKNRNRKEDRIPNSE